MESEKMEYNINDLTKDELLHRDFIPQIFENYSDENERNQILNEVYKVAKEKAVLTKVKKSVQNCESEYKIEHKDSDIYNILVLGINGKPEPTIDNYYNVITTDDFIKQHIKFNLLSNKFEYWSKNRCREWRDKDDAWLLSYIEKEYDFYNLQKYELAKNKTEDIFAYHPIKDLIEEEEWDGKPRIDNFLSSVMKCENDDYSREVSRMIFYGGINRLYNPGCKFDYMPILMGNQGCVDCDTEYFNGTEWKKISEYNSTDKVLQYTESGKAELVEPLNYIKQKSDYLWHFETKYGLNQTLSDNHNVYYVTSKGNLYHKEFKDIRLSHKEHPFSGRFISAFDYSGEGISLTDDEIRVMIACFADGSIQHKTMRFNLKKERKIKRLCELLEKANIKYTKYFILPKPSL